MWTAGWWKSRNLSDHCVSRCACKCPEAAWFDIKSSWEERKIYINSSVEAADCDCEHVVVPLLNLDAEMAEKFCPRCLCKAETRSVLTIKVVVGLIIWVLALLLIYLGYLVCLEPLLTGSPRQRATGQYRHHQVLIGIIVIINFNEDTRLNSL